jgi:hypothetical protein
MDLQYFSRNKSEHQRNSDSCTKQSVNSLLHYTYMITRGIKYLHRTIINVQIPRQPSSVFHQPVKVSQTNSKILA